MTLPLVNSGTDLAGSPTASPPIPRIRVPHPRPPVRKYLGPQSLNHCLYAVAAPATYDDPAGLRTPQHWGDEGYQGEGY